MSVCMAAYNGEKFIAEQIASILDQLGEDDEIVVIDDRSTDGTLEALRALDDPRLRVIEQETNRGYVRTFERALGEARGTYLLLSDQDDIWLPGHVDDMVAALATHNVVASNLTTLDGPDAIPGPYGQRDWHLSSAGSRRRVRNTVGILAGAMPYYGCAMGIRREALGRGASPFPRWLDESHDLWLALYGNVVGRMAHLDARTVARRFHESNQTPTRPRGVVPVLRSRLMLVGNIGLLLARRVRRGARR
ncbi:glycosyltransferase family 2 protein [Brachybacterium huguangmaarense]